MRLRIILAIVLFFLALIQVVDWLIFSIKDENQKLNVFQINAKYIQRFSEPLKSYFHNPAVSTLVCIILFGIVGLLFVNEKRKVFFILGIFSFVLAGWQLFTLM
jgi:uncharacterized membrane protein